MENFISKKNLNESANYLSNQVQLMVNLDEFQLDRLISNELQNPLLENLASLENFNFLDEEGEDNDKESDVNLLIQAEAKPRILRIISFFKRLKRKIRRLFCKYIIEYGGGSIDAIVKKILDALSNALPFKIPIYLFNLISPFIAKLFKKGQAKVCPVV